MCYCVKVSDLIEQHLVDVIDFQIGSQRFCEAS